VRGAHTGYTDTLRPSGRAELIARRAVNSPRPRRPAPLSALHEREDPHIPPLVGYRGPDDDHRLALAIDRRAYLVTGEQDRLVLSNDLPILTPPQVLTRLRTQR
jgi:hypothetical protein